MKKYNYYIGIDPGVETGITLYSSAGKKIEFIGTKKIHEAMALVKQWSSQGVLVRVEDARQRKWFGKSGREKLMGAGSIKRDCKIWEDFLTSIGVDFEMVAPKNNKTKLSADTFKRLTNYKGQTSEHARDSALLVFGK
jgi:hypothetical protein